jgi:FixJ family two-component response regulator
MAVISVVDDDEPLRSATIDLLNSAGYPCEAFGSAGAWLMSASVSETACLILDIRMPGMTGLELQQRLMSMDLPTPIIFVTAYPEERARRQAMNSGALCFLPKPFDDQELLDCVRLALARRGQTTGDQDDD